LQCISRHLRIKRTDGNGADLVESGPDIIIIDQYPALLEIIIVKYFGKVLLCLKAVTYRAQLYIVVVVV
jgi:hypothetical protein